MKNKSIFALFLVLMLCFAAFLSSAKQTDSNSVPGELIVKLKQNQDVNSLGIDSSDIKPVKSPNGKVSKQFDRFYLVKASDVDKTIKNLKKLQTVEYAEPNYIIKIDQSPNDPYFVQSKLYGLNNDGSLPYSLPDADIDAPEAWDYKTGSDGIIIAVIDTGIDYNHEDLSSNVWVNSQEMPNNGIDDDSNGFIDDYLGWDFANNDNDPMDDNGHGTHVSGIIGAVGNNGVGVVGVNWNTRIMPLKAFDSSGYGSDFDAISAINYAVSMGAKVISNSWGGDEYSQALKDAIEYSNQAGSLFVAAAGNDGLDSDFDPHYPSGYDVGNIISVAATDREDHVSWFSNYGLRTVDLGAPGYQIYSTLPNGNCTYCSTTGYGQISGTSMATPFAAGAAALIWSQNLQLTNLQIKDKIMRLTDFTNPDVGLPTFYMTLSGGRLNINNLLEPDSDAPAGIVDLIVVNSSGNSIILSFTAVGDDGLAGISAKYDLRYSLSQITNANFDAASKVRVPKPKNSGNVDSIVVNGLEPDLQYYFAVKALDNVGNSGAISNIATARTQPMLNLFYFSGDSNISGWSQPTGNGESGFFHLSSRKYRSILSSLYYGREDTGTYEYGNYDSFGSLTTPAINLSNIESAELVFWQFLETDYNRGDKALVYVQTVGSDDLFQASATRNTFGQWERVSFDLSNFYGQLVQIRFSFEGNNIDNNLEGWFIDDIVVRGTPSQINSRPTARANGPYYGYVGNQILMNSSGSSSPVDSPLIYFWNFSDGTFSNQSNPLHEYYLSAHYVASLVVKDLFTNESSEQSFAHVYIYNRSVANAGSDMVITDFDNNGFEIVLLNGSSSMDPYIYSNLNYLWIDNAGVIGNQSIQSANLSVGLHNISLKVVNYLGFAFFDNLTVNVVGVVTSVNAGVNQSVVDIDGDGKEFVLLNGTIVNPVQGAAYDFTWVEEYSSTNFSQSFATSLAAGVNLSVGSHKMWLNTIRKFTNQSYSNFTYVTVIPKPNQAPIANAGPDKKVIDSDGNGVQAVSLSGLASYDPDGSIVAYLWKEGTTTLGTVSTINPSLAVGSHSITLHVTDNKQATASDTVKVEVTDKITISRADYKVSTKELYVQAKSTKSNAQLTLVGYGPLVKSGSTWTYKVKPVSDPGAKINVTSSFGGSAIANVKRT